MAKSFHRHFFPNAKPGQDRRAIRPVMRADPVVTHEGVELVFLEQKKRLTPTEINNLCRWLTRLRIEAETAAAHGLIDENNSFDAEAVASG